MSWFKIALSTTSFPHLPHDTLFRISYGPLGGNVEDEFGTSAGCQPVRLPSFNSHASLDVWETPRNFFVHKKVQRRTVLLAVHAVLGDTLFELPFSSINLFIYPSPISLYYNQPKCSSYTRPPWATACSRSQTRPKSKVPICTRSSTRRRRPASCTFFLFCLD